MEEGEAYAPFVAPKESPAELTIKAVGCGIVFGILFDAANAYLGLVAGVTISTSIPVAVVAVAAFRTLERMGSKSTILEPNSAQTVGSASSSVASGVIFMMGRRTMVVFALALSLAVCGPPNNEIGAFAAPAAAKATTEAWNADQPVERLVAVPRTSYPHDVDLFTQGLL